MNKMDVKILAVETKKLFPDGIWEGVKEIDKDWLFEFIKNQGKFLRRGDLEEDESYQQIICQILLLVGDKFFLHEIPETGSETRLHHKVPIFLGGHIDSTDGSIQEAVDREFSEEINFQGKILSKDFFGIVKLHDNPVNKVHAGLIFVYTGDEEKFSDNQDDGISKGRFVSWEEAEKYLDSMSYWSKVAFPVLKEKYFPKK